MKTTLFLLSLLFTASAYAGMYKWVDANGEVTYSDMPPPASAAAKKLQKKAIVSTDNDESSLPYSLASVSRDHPVTLYAASQCTPCEDARSFLKKRGIPFSEKSVVTNNDMDMLRQAGGDGRLPFILVGSVQLTGFDKSAWNNALTAAGYPESSHLPGNYRFPQTQPAAAPAANTDGAN